MTVYNYKYLCEGSIGGGIIKYCSSLPGLIVGKSEVNLKDIKDAEDALGCKFAKEYKDIVLKYGFLLADGIELTGICKAKNRNVVIITQREREYNSNVPNSMYVVENTGIDGIIIWQDSTGSIYKTSYTSNPQKIASSLLEYLKSIE